MKKIIIIMSNSNAQTRLLKYQKPELEAAEKTIKLDVMHHKY